MRSDVSTSISVTQQFRTLFKLQCNMCPPEHVSTGLDMYSQRRDQISQIPPTPHVVEL